MEITKGFKFTHKHMLNPADFGKPEHRRSKAKCEVTLVTDLMVCYVAEGSKMVWRTSRSSFFKEYGNDAS